MLPTGMQIFLGLVAVSTGMLPICRDEQGLAAVLGHGKSLFCRPHPLTNSRIAEIGHVVLRHSIEKLSSTSLVTAVLFLAALFGLDFGLGDAASQVLYELPNSRTQEREADLVGLRLMAKACYDPQAAPE